MTANWTEKGLGEVCDFRAGGAFPQREQGLASGDYPFIKVSDMTLPANSKRIVTANNWVTEATAARMKLKLAPAGSVAFAKIGEGLKAERLRQITRPTAMDNNMMAAVPKQDVVDEHFLLFLLESVHLASWAEGSALPYLRQKDLSAIPVTVPEISEQRAIAATLGALDDKIESNLRQRQLLREIGLAEYQASVRDDRRSLQLSAATVSIARGVAPKYADEDLDAALVINQKCIRNGWVSLAPARRMFDRSVKTEKRASSGDILVNSTGTGTLGRVARWHAGDIYVDGHVSVVKADHSVTSPTVLAYSLLGREADIEGLATGSTGQTELSAARLGELRVILPPTDQGSRLEATLITIEDRCDQLAAENTHLESTRDVLLPELLSGRIRVPVEGVEA